MTNGLELRNIRVWAFMKSYEWRLGVEISTNMLQINVGNDASPPHIGIFCSAILLYFLRRVSVLLSSFLTSV